MSSKTPKMIKYNKEESHLNCADVLSFEHKLLSIRKFDDKIINILNTEIPTESFYLKEANPSKKCDQFKQELTDYYDFRENEILKCIDSTKKDLEALKSNPSAKNLVREKNANLRMFHQELDVERIMRKNTYKTVEDRCNKYL